MACITPPDPAAAFRFHLLMSLAPFAGTADPVELAQRAEDFIRGAATEPPITATPQDERHDEAAETPPAAGRGAEGIEGSQPPEGDDLQRDAVAGNGGDDGAGEPGGPAPAKGVGREDGQETLKADPPAPAASRGKRKTWTPELIEQLRALCAEGMEAKDIEATMALGPNGAFSNACRLGFTEMWREARQRRRAGTAAPSLVKVPVSDIVHINPTADIETPVKLVVELPPPAASVAPSADDLAAAALEVDRPDSKGPFLVARDVPQGESWAFRDHRTLAEVGVLEPAPEAAPAPPPLPSADERQRLIEEHIAKHGVTTTIPEFGPDQPAVDVLRNACNSLVRAKPQTGPGLPRPWILNGGPVTTERLWKSANAELKSQGKRPIKRQA